MHSPAMRQAIQNAKKASDDRILVHALRRQAKKMTANANRLRQKADDLENAARLMFDHAYEIAGD